MIDKIPGPGSNIAAYLVIAILWMTLFSACQKNPVKACFTYQPADNITTQTLVTFDATCSKNTDYVRWTFGDGTPDTIAADGVFTISHQYALPGNYRVVLLAVKGKDQVWGKNEPLTEQIVIVN